MLGRRQERPDPRQVAVEAGAAAVTQQLDGRDAYVVEQPLGDGIQRVFIDADSYIPVKVEFVREGVVVNSTAVPLYEFTEGNTMPMASSSPS